MFKVPFIFPIDKQLYWKIEWEMLLYFDWWIDHVLTVDISEELLYKGILFKGDQIDSVSRGDSLKYTIDDLGIDSL